MNKIRTAAELIASSLGTRDKMCENFNLSGDIEELMINFARTHVLAAMLSICKHATCIRYYPKLNKKGDPAEYKEDKNGKIILSEDDEEGNYEFPYIENSGCVIDLNSDSVYTSYSPNLIK